MTEPKHTVTMTVKVDHSEFDAFAEKFERTAARLDSIRGRSLAWRIALMLVLAFVALYFIEQRTEQACLAAGHAPEACRTSLEDL